MKNGGETAVYTFVIFCIVLVVGITMISNIVDSNNATNISGSPEGGVLGDTVSKVTGSIGSGLSFVVAGIGLLGAVIALKGLDYF